MTSTTLLLLLVVALVACSATNTAARRPSKRSVTKFTTATVAVPQGPATASSGSSNKLELTLPVTGKELSIASPQSLYRHIEEAWETVVAHNQAGLVAAEAQAKGEVSPELSSAEAWHHWQAGQEGVVDSARFLVTFNLVPSVQTGGSKLHVAAASGDADYVRALLDGSDESSDDMSVMTVDTESEKELDGATPLHTAVTLGHAKVVSALLKAGANIEARAKHGATPLMIAASMGHVDVATALLDAGAQVAAAHSYAGNTALHFAAEMGNLGIISLLCSRGANVDATKTTGSTPLHTAADVNQTAAVRLLLSAPCNADPHALMSGDTTPLYLAAQRGWTEVVKVLLQHMHADSVQFSMPQGAVHKHVQALDQTNAAASGFYSPRNTEVGNGATALHAAVENGHLATVDALLAGGAKQATTMQGVSPLLLAIQYHHPKIALRLLAAGADVAHVDVPEPRAGATPLLAAAEQGYTSVVEALLQAGAHADKADHSGTTPLIVAAARGRTAIVQALLRAGADARKGSNDGTTPLHAAAHKDSEAIATALLDHIAAHEKEEEVSAAVGAPGPDGQTPLHIAASRSSVDCLVAMVAASAKSARSGDLAQQLQHADALNARVTSTGATALMMAAKAGSAKAVAVLIASGADVGLRARKKPLYKCTALYLAAQNGHADAVALLLEAGAEVDERLYKFRVTPLGVAAERGHLLAVERLLAAGASTGARDATGGHTPLMLAIRAGQTKTAAALVHAGARLDTRDDEGRTPLLHLLREPGVQVKQADNPTKEEVQAWGAAYQRVLWLLRQRASVLDVRGPPRSPAARKGLTQAEKRGYEGVLLALATAQPSWPPKHAVELLRTLAAFFEASRSAAAPGRFRSLTGRPLKSKAEHTAWFWNGGWLVDVPKKGANEPCWGQGSTTNQKKKGKKKGKKKAEPWDPLAPSALTEACARGRINVVHALLQSGADVNQHAVATSGDTGGERYCTWPLHEAVRHGSEYGDDLATALVELLLQHGARIDVHDSHGDTALDIAVAGRHFDLTKLLQQRGD